jgi:large subunit ribosomal protein L18
MKKEILKNKRRQKRKLRVRKKISGSDAIPRISIFRSNVHLYVQAIDDLSGKTIAAISNQGDFKNLKVNVKDAAKLGEEFGKKLKASKITKAVFDRNGYLFHGVIKSFADGTRKAGIEF